MERLAKAHPHCVTELTHQYRMNEQIQVLPNTLIYDQKLRCGTQGVAERRLARKRTVLLQGGTSWRVRGQPTNQFTRGTRS